MPKYILALDQGTTSSRAILFDRNGNAVSSAQKELTQFYPRQGWVEHDPAEIYSSQYGAMMETIDKSGVKAEDIAAIGITNQRETTILWDKNTGLPVYNALVWQCRRTAGEVEALKAQGLTDYIQKTTGLLPDAYFSGTKIKWILDQVKGVRERAEKGEILFGTVDSWLIWKLTGGAVHATDYTNASRTMLYDINKLEWDNRLLEILNIPKKILPEVMGSSGIYGYASVNGVKLPIAGIAGDQQSALFGQTCFERGEIKNTYGTGCFLLMNIGDKPVFSQNGLITTLAASTDMAVQYALEGSVFAGGAVIQWLRDELGMLKESSEAGYYARQVEDAGGVYMVPAFTGLGAPYWDMYARGSIYGLTRGSRREHIIRAAEESIAYQCLEIVEAMERDSGTAVKELRVDGGASRDMFLMQFQADILGKKLYRPRMQETTALGAAFLAGLAVGFWSGKSELKKLTEDKNSGSFFEPDMPEEKRRKLLNGWRKAVSRSLDWEERE
jgi:glycerol kinase